MPDIKTIDEILRRRGREKLTAEINKLFAPIIDYKIVGGGDCSALFVGLYEPTGEKDSPNNWRSYHGEIHAFKAIEMIKEGVIARDALAYEQAEIDAFLKKLDEVSEDVDNLRNELLG